MAQHSHLLSIMRFLRKRRFDSVDTRHRQKRSGAVTVEFAMVSPVLFLIAFGMLELSRAQTIAGAARTGTFAGAREAAVANTNATKVRDQVVTILDILDVDDREVTISPEDFSDASRVTISVRVPFSPANGCVFHKYLGSSEINYSTTVER